MPFYRKIIITLFGVLAISTTLAAPRPLLFLFLEGDSAQQHQKLLTQPYVCGAQIIYSWRELEPRKNVYNFSKIQKDLNFLNHIHKKLFVQIQDRTFDPDHFAVPDYIRTDSIYQGGEAPQTDFAGEGKPLGSGWVARMWDPNVAARYQLLLTKLAQQFDGKIYGINFPETAADFNFNPPPAGFTADKYFHAELNNLLIAKKLFRHSIIVQYVNFFPQEWNNDHHYMSQLFTTAIKNNIGLGGPDVVPYRKAQMKNSYPFFNHYRGKLLVAMAIQQPDYTYKNPQTGKHFNFADLYSFSQNYLGAAILFWNIEEPFFSKKLQPHLNQKFFRMAAESPHA